MPNKRKSCCHVHVQNPIPTWARTNWRGNANHVTTRSLLHLSFKTYQMISTVFLEAIHLRACLLYDVLVLVRRLSGNEFPVQWVHKCKQTWTRQSPRKKISKRAWTNHTPHLLRLQAENCCQGCRSIKVRVDLQSMDLCEIYHWVTSIFFMLKPVSQRPCN